MRSAQITGTAKLLRPNHLRLVVQKGTDGMSQSGPRSPGCQSREQLGLDLLIAEVG